MICKMPIENKLQRSMAITKNGVNLLNDEGIRDTLIYIIMRQWR
jgi:hypothetical protein